MKTIEQIRADVIAGDTDSLYKSGYWEDKRLNILKRDHYQCQRCLGKFGNVDRIRLKKANTVHHIIELKDAPELMLEDDNLISLCSNCHNIVHDRVPKCFYKKKKRVTEERW